MKFKDDFDLTIIGGGPGGLAAALKAKDLGLKKVLIIEREKFLGGILPQCIHVGFGLDIFKKQLSGPEYLQFFIDKVNKTDINILTSSMVLDVFQDKSIIFANKEFGIKKINSKAIILATGCRERTRGAIQIPGSRPSGVFTAGLVQRMVNIKGYLPGKEIVIIGSGDVGLIMARRLFLEGCNVNGVFEIMPFPTGLPRNIMQCLYDFDIPLNLSHTVTRICGEDRIGAVDIAKVDMDFNPDIKTLKKINCDTLLLSVGLIPENELSINCKIKLDSRSEGPIVNQDLQTGIEGIFSCGNSLFVNDIVDDVTLDGYFAAERVVEYISYKSLRKSDKKINLNIVPGNNVRFVVPQKITSLKNISFKIRPKKPMENSKIIFGNTGFSKKTGFITPGQLLKINFNQEYFKKLENFLGRIQVDLVEEKNDK